MVPLGVRIDLEASGHAKDCQIDCEGGPTVYHVISRVALDGFVLGDVEKEYLLKLIKDLSSVYFVEVLGFCLMGNHFHLLVRMQTGDGPVPRIGNRRHVKLV